MRHTGILPFNLQMFAEPGSGEGTPPQSNTPPEPQAGATQSPEIDYDKIAQLVAGKQAVTEESVIKGYLKQQGLTKEQMNQAIATYKEQQAANTQDVTAIQTQAQQAQELAQQKEVENAAILQAVQLGIDAKTIPYVLKMADLSTARGTDGNISEESLKKALDKVLEDIPALKPQANQASGFQLGAASGNQTTTNEDALKKAFGL